MLRVIQLVLISSSCALFIICFIIKYSQLSVNSRINYISQTRYKHNPMSFPIYDKSVSLYERAFMHHYSLFSDTFSDSYPPILINKALIKAMDAENHFMNSSLSFSHYNISVPPSFTYIDSLSYLEYGHYPKDFFYEYHFPTLTFPSDLDIHYMYPILVSNNSERSRYKGSEYIIPTDTRFTYYSLPNATTYQEILPPVKLVLIIRSSALNYDKREVVRNTFANPRFLHQHQNDIKVLFSLGIPHNITFFNEIVLHEQKQYNDLIIFNIADTYVNMTLKTMLTMEFFRSFHLESTFLMLSDDDSCIHLDRMLSYINHIRHLFSIIPETPVYTGVAYTATPSTSTNSLYFFSKRITFNSFDFAYGPGSIFSPSVVNRIHYYFKKQQYISHVDDAQIGYFAILANISFFPPFLHHIDGTQLLSWNKTLQQTFFFITHPTYTAKNLYTVCHDIYS